MTLKLWISKLDDVPEAQRGLYVEKDGKFMLDVEGVEDVSGLKSALGKEREDRKRAEAMLKSFKDAGIESPELARELAEKLEAMSKLDPTKEADRIAQTKIEAATRQLLEKHGKETGKLKGESEALLAQLQEVLVDNAATKALAEAKGAVDLLLPHVRSATRIKRHEGNGKFVVEVLGPDGNPRIGDAQGNPMSIDQLVAEMKSSDKYGRAFEGAGASGSGGAGSGGGGTRGTGVKQVSVRDQAAINANLKGIADGSVVVVD